MSDATWFVGGERPVDGSGETRDALLPAHHLTTRGVVVGMTGSGKTGLLSMCWLGRPMTRRVLKAAAKGR